MSKMAALAIGEQATRQQKKPVSASEHFGSRFTRYWVKRLSRTALVVGRWVWRERDGLGDSGLSDSGIYFGCFFRGCPWWTPVEGPRPEGGAWAHGEPRSPRTGGGGASGICDGVTAAGLLLATVLAARLWEGYGWLPAPLSACPVHIPLLPLLRNTGGLSPSDKPQWLVHLDENPLYMPSQLLESTGAVAKTPPPASPSPLLPICLLPSNFSAVCGLRPGTLQRGKCSQGPLYHFEQRHPWIVMSSGLHAGVRKTVQGHNS